MTARRKTRDEKNARPSKGNRRSSEGSTNKQKGKLVEKVAAMLHEGPDVKVERNVFLSPPNGDPKRRRKIDVFITSYVAGYPVRIRSKHFVAYSYSPCQGAVWKNRITVPSH